MKRGSPSDIGLTALLILVWVLVLAPYTCADRPAPAPAAPSKAPADTCRPPRCYPDPDPPGGPGTFNAWRLCRDCRFAGAP